jgi:hypothetical protein
MPSTPKPRTHIRRIVGLIDWENQSEASAAMQMGEMRRADDIKMCADAKLIDSSH